MTPAEFAALKTLRRKVVGAFRRYHKHETRCGAGSGPDWRVGRLLNENYHRGKRIINMSAEECRDALGQLGVIV